MPNNKVILDIDGTLEIDPRDLEVIDAWDLERLRHCVYEIMVSTVEVNIARGNVPIRAKLRFSTPTPYELKLAKVSGDRGDG